MKQPGETIVSFDAARLGIYSVFLVVLPDEILLGRPGPRPHRRILDRYGIFKRVRPRPRPPLDHVKILARPLKIGLRTEVRYIDDECIALPMAARVAVPLANTGRQMGAPVHEDIALPALALTHVVEHRDAAGCLHDAPEADAICDRSKRADLRHPTHQAAHRQRGVLRTVIAIDGRGVVARRRLRETPRGSRIVLSPATWRLFIFAGFGGLQQGNAKFAFGGGTLLSLLRRRRESGHRRVY